MLLNILLMGAITVTGADKPANIHISDTVHLKEVVINSKLKRYSSGLTIKSIPSYEIRVGESTQLSELLSNQSNISVNSYGSGGTSGVSLRGLKASQTAILWNGINLQGTMNGEVNVGTIPTFFIDQIAVQEGGNGALFGSGAIGGVIHLDNTLDFNEGHKWSILQTVGSSWFTYSGLKHSYSNQKSSFATRIFYSESPNDYRFKNVNAAGKPIERQKNANFRKSGIMANSAFTITPNDKLVIALWGQENYSRYPQPMSGGNDTPYDFTSFARGTAQWQAKRDKYSFSVKAALLNDWEAYRSPAATFGGRSNHHTTLGLLEADAIIPLNRHTIEAGINGSYERARSTDYDGIKDRYKPSATLGYRYKSNSNKLETFASLRQEVIDTKINPLTWSAGALYTIIKGLNIRGNVSRNYRVPTFNELYWGNGWGNPNLKPEHGYGEELGIDFFHSQDGFLFSSKLSIFSNNVKGWIMWTPVGTSWNPMNVDKVWSRGADIGITLKQRIQQYTVGCDISFLFTKSTNQDTKLQLPYTPRTKENISLSFQAPSYLIRYTHSFIGQRELVKNAGTLPSYSIAGLSLEKNFKIKGYLLSTFTRIDNLWNVDYQSIADYGMPLRNYQLGVRLNIGGSSEK